MLAKSCFALDTTSEGVDAADAEGLSSPLVSNDSWGSDSPLELSLDSAPAGVVGAAGWAGSAAIGDAVGRFSGIMLCRSRTYEKARSYSFS